MSKKNHGYFIHNDSPAELRILEDSGYCDDKASSDWIVYAIASNGNKTIIYKGKSEKVARRMWEACMTIVKAFNLNERPEGQ